MEHAHPFAGILLDDILDVITAKNVRKFSKQTGKNIEVMTVQYVGDLVETKPYESYEIQGQKYRLAASDHSGLKGLPSFMPYYEYHSVDYAQDAYNFMFRTHKKFEEILRFVSTSDNCRWEQMTNLLGSRPASSKELLDLLQSSQLVAQDKSEGENTWAEFIQKFVRVEQLSLEMVGIIRKEITDTKSRTQLKNIIPKDLEHLHTTLSLELMEISNALPLPKIRNITENDIRASIKEITSEAYKAPVHKGRETLFFLNRASKIAGCIECIDIIKKSVEKNCPTVSEVFNKFCDAKCRLLTIRRREPAARRQAILNYNEKLQDFTTALDNMPEGIRKNHLLDIVAVEGIIAEMGKLRYPLVESAKLAAENLDIASKKTTYPLHASL